MGKKKRRKANKKGRYLQARGKPNVGIRDPEKYGLTLAEVIELVNDGKWNAYLQVWNANKRKRPKVAELNFICPICNKRLPDLDDWLNSGKYCRACSAVKVKRDAVEQGRIHQRKSKLKERTYCLHCAVRVDTKRLLCGSCNKVFKVLEKKRKGTHETPRKRII